MSEVLLSPGVFMRENDLSQITQGPIQAPAALIGPTVSGKVNVPTYVTSYSDFKNKFGSTFISGGLFYEYFTSLAAMNYFEQGGDSLLVVRVASGSYTPATASIPSFNGDASFELETLSVGKMMNNASTQTGSILVGGSSSNIRWEITSVNSGSGTFSLLIRRGDDYANNVSILESWQNLSLDPNQNNYIGYVIGDLTEVPTLDDSGNYYLQPIGSYENKSRYVRVKSVNYPTPNYFDSMGRAKPEFTGSLPMLGSGSGLFGGLGGFDTAIGDYYGCEGVAPLNMFDLVPTSSANIPVYNIQGLLSSDYDIALNMLANKDYYKYNVIYAPGLNAQNSPNQLNTMIQNAQNRGDNIAVVDMTGFASNTVEACYQATTFDTSYAATYWPWVQIRSKETGKINNVPASTVIPAVYEYNDKVAAEWWAPAGLNRGGLSGVIRAEKALGVNVRNILQANKVNPISTLFGVGNVVYGQKTLQSKPSALDRVNVRRLLISLKSYIGNIAEGIIFEPNNQVTRNKFLNQVNPYLESIQQQNGIYAFQVIMDDTNNTPDVIDRNQLVGSIYLQPTRTAEYIYLDFNILPTGVTFGQ